MQNNLVVERLKSQIAFIAEVDQIKHIVRMNYLSDGSRRENDAEHSWHLALMAVLLAEHANEPNLDVGKAVKMVLIHDVVEIDAGDTYAYDAKGMEDQAEREQKAADRIFAILPEDQAKEFRAIWDEFEERKTPEAKYAAALDRLHPMLLNFLSGGKSWIDNGITQEMARNRNKHAAEGSETLWNFAEHLIKESGENGYLK
ncbi:HD domain-containing protein [Flammeovirgaceae bacterium SG7u.111]|nr:HD domain-containing protein [Flammeovirgaceae bacterium SG7u.132]WPO36775.1 HD domain-containing protein [Flammeovirgaceae bacterium SG7u.111]